MTSEPVGGSARAHLRGPRIILAAHGVGLPVVDPGGRVQALEGPRDHDQQRRSDSHHGPGQRRQQATSTESCRHCSRRHLWLHGPADGGEGELMALHASSSRARQRSPAGRHEGVRRRGASHQERDHRSLRHRDRDTMVKMLGNGEASPADNIYMRRIISLNTMGGDVERGLAPSWRSSARRCGQGQHIHRLALVRRRAHSTMDRQEAVKWGATGSADTAGGLVDLSNVRRMSLADNNVPVATGMFQERRAQDGPGGRSPGKGVSSWFGWKRNTDSTTQAEEVMQRKSADAARFLGTRSSAHSGKVQVHPSAQKHRLASADQPFWLRCIPDRCCSCLNSQPATPGELRGLSKLRSDRARARAEDVQARLSQQA